MNANIILPNTILETKKGGYVMTRKKLIALVTSVAMLAGVMSGCGISAPEQTTGTGADQNAPAAPSAAAPASDSSEPVTLRFSWWGGDARHEATLAVIEAYEKLHPNVTIEPEYGSYDGYSEKTKRNSR